MYICGQGWYCKHSVAIVNPLSYVRALTVQEKTANLVFVFRFFSAVSRLHLWSLTVTGRIWES